MDVVKINGASVARINYKNKPVITLRMMDELHDRFEGAARQAFHRNKKHLIENEDYYVVPYEEWSLIPCVSNIYAHRKDYLTFLTQTGYLLIAKTFTGKLAWQIQRELVNGYFGRHVKEMDVEAGITASAVLFFDTSSGKFALRNLGKQEPQAAHSQKKRKGATTNVTGLSRNFCNNTIYKAYKRGRSLVRVIRGVYKRAECQ